MAFDRRLSRIPRNLLLPAVVKPRCPRIGVASEILDVFKGDSLRCLQHLPRLLQGKSLGSQQGATRRKQSGSNWAAARGSPVDGVQDASNFAHDGLV
jgi:hypothetical protein